MFIAILCIVVLVVVLSPYLISATLLFPHALGVFKRIKMLSHIKKVAHAEGYALRHLHRFVLISRNRADKYDLLVENAERAFAVKLWSAWNPHKTLIIGRNGKVREGAIVPEALSVDKRHRYVMRGRELSVPVTKQNFSVKKDKPVVCILLIYPKNKQILLDYGDRRVRLEECQIIFGKTVYGVIGFKKLLRESRMPRVDSDTENDIAEA